MMWEYRALVYLCLFLTGLSSLTKIFGEDLPKPKTYRPIWGQFSIKDTGSSEEGIYYRSTVEQKGKKYVYTYVLRNIGKKNTWLTSWALLNRASALGDEAYLFNLKPGEHTQLVLTSDEAPVRLYGDLKGLRSETNNNSEARWRKDRGYAITGVAPTFYHDMTTSAWGYLPKSYAPKKD